MFLRTNIYSPSNCPLLRPVKEDAGRLMALALSSSDRRELYGAVTVSSVSTSPS